MASLFSQYKQFFRSKSNAFTMAGGHKSGFYLRNRYRERIQIKGHFDEVPVTGKMEGSDAALSKPLKKGKLQGRV